MNLWTSNREEAIQRYGHISTWQTGEVTDMSQLFKDKKKFNEDISSWDVSNVTNMGYMFAFASSFNQPLEKWDVCKVTIMNRIFYNATSFNQPLLNWKISHRVFNFMRIETTFDNSLLYESLKQSLNFDIETLSGEQLILLMSVCSQEGFHPVPQHVQPAQSESR